jgi:hypothetical protein
MPLSGLFYIGGRGGIRTPDGVSPMHVFETCAFNPSATLPYFVLPFPPSRVIKLAFFPIFR